MANTRLDLVGDGSTTVYDVAFDLGYISKDHVYVYLEGDNYTNQLVYDWVGNTQVELDGAVDVGVEFHIRRVVPRNELVNYYADGSILREDNLDDSFLQALMINEEQTDGYSGADSIWVENVDANSFRLINLPKPTSASEPATKEVTDALDSRQTATEAGLVSTSTRVTSLESRTTSTEGTNTAQNIRLQTLESLVPSDLVSNVLYATVNEVLGDKYKLGSIFDDMDAYDTALGAVYLGTATPAEIALISKINTQLGARFNG